MFDVTNNQRLGLKYLIDLMKTNHGFQFASNIESIVSHFSFSSKFYAEIPNGKSFNHAVLEWNDGWIINEEGERDLIATAIYVLNCVDEWGRPAECFDELGRFRYEFSYQAQNPEKSGNFVFIILKEIASLLNHSLKEQLNYAFISHDIDTINGSLIQDSYALLKKNKPISALKHIFKESFNKQKSWDNLEEINQVNASFGFESCFFLLTQKGRGTDNVMNADYGIQQIQKYFESPAMRNAHFGLHKASTVKSIRNELEEVHNLAPFNRHHFLKFQLPALWHELDEGDVYLDSSLGYPEQFGYRNSYQLPFHPINHEDFKMHKVLEVPLTLMDGTFHKYLKLDDQKTLAIIRSFIQQSKANRLISLLWHNTFFTNIKYNQKKELYIKILQLLQQEGYIFLGPSEIVEKFQNQDLWK